MDIVPFKPKDVCQQVNSTILGHVIQHGVYAYRKLKNHCGKVVLGFIKNPNTKDSKVDV